MDKNPLARARDTGPIPGPRRFHMPKGNLKACEPQLLRPPAELLKPVCLEPALCTRDAAAERSPWTQLESGLCSRQLEEARAQ